MPRRGGLFRPLASLMSGGMSMGCTDTEVSVTTEHDALFRSWLEDMHPRLARFVDIITPAGWSGGCSRESLVALERHMLDRWPDVASFQQEQDTDFIDGATRYIGETYLRLGGGGWFVDHDPKFVFSGRPCVRLDTVDPLPISPVNLMGAVLSRRTGEVLARVWDGQTENLAERREVEGPGWEPVREPVPGLFVERLGSPELEAWVQRVPALVDVVRSRAGSERARSLDLSPLSLEVLAQVALEDADAGHLAEGVQGDARAAYVAYLGTVAIGAAGGSWVLLQRPDNHENPFVGRPFVERTDSDGDRRTALPDGAVDALLTTRSTDVFARMLWAYTV